MKVDHNQTDNDRLSVRLSYSRPVTTDASVYGIYGGPRGVGGSGFEGTGMQNTYSGAINYNHIFSPTLITEARFGVNRYRNDAQQFGYGQNTADALGIPGINGIPWTSGPPGDQPRAITATRSSASPPVFPGFARKRTFCSPTSGPRRSAITPSSSAAKCAASATICCKRKPTTPAAKSSSAALRRPSRAPTPASVQFLRQFPAGCALR